MGQSASFFLLIMAKAGILYNGLSNQYVNSLIVNGNNIFAGTFEGKYLFHPITEQAGQAPDLLLVSIVSQLTEAFYLQVRSGESISYNK